MSEEMPEEIQQKIGQLQMIEQNMQNFTAQKQMMQSQLLEVESAIEELKEAKEAFKIVGNIMVSTKKEDLSKDLIEKQELLKARVDSLETQEGKLREKAESIQKDLLEAMK